MSVISTEGLAMRPRGGPRSRKPKPEMVEQEEAIDSSDGKSSCLYSSCNADLYFMP